MRYNICGGQQGEAGLGSVRSLPCIQFQVLGRHGGDALGADHRLVRGQQFRQDQYPAILAPAQADCGQQGSAACAPSRRRAVIDQPGLIPRKGGFAIGRRPFGMRLPGLSAQPSPRKVQATAPTDELSFSAAIRSVRAGELDVMHVERFAYRFRERALGLVPGYCLVAEGYPNQEELQAPGNLPAPDRFYGFPGGGGRPAGRCSISLPRPGRSAGAPGLITDVGFGVSQVLPVLVLCYYAPEGSILLLEQPEIHLHPAVQAGLADVFVEVMKERRIQIILEATRHLWAAETTP
ncbi:MAG: AAA family ATPase [Anaerolineae bacterium]|nr:AAA family ATPase [Anaerolineae bacterium]